MLSEYYGFARLKFHPSDITITEEDLKKKYSSCHMRVPEFVAGRQIVEVKRVCLSWNIPDIVRKACEKAHERIIIDENIIVYHICYVVPSSTSKSDAHSIIKQIKSVTSKHSHIMYVKRINICFTMAPDHCFFFE